MLKKQRRERFASYEELIATIESVQAQFTLSASPLELHRPSGAVAASQPTPASGSPSPPGSATPATAPVVPLRKSKFPLYGGIGAGVLALGVAAFLFWPKEEKLTKAQIYAKQHAGEQKAAVVVPDTTPAPQPAPVRSESAKPDPASAEPTAIHLWNSADKIPKGKGANWEDDALRLDVQ